jgi:hypothetical protein
MPVDGRRDFIQPGLVGNLASESLPRKFLHAITLRMAERFEQARPNEQRNVMTDKHILAGRLIDKETNFVFEVWAYRKMGPKELCSLFPRS